MPLSVRIIALVLLTALVGGCANYASLQSPETMPEGAAELGVGGTFNAYTLEIETTSTQTQPDGTLATETTETREPFAVPALAFWLRYGVTEELELHGMAWFPFGATLGGKYMVVGERDKPGFVLSPGLDVSMPLEVTVNDDSATFFDVYVPLHAGYRVNERVAVYLTPKYVMRFLGGDLGHSGGGTLGVALGDETTFLLEGGAYYDTLADDVILNGAIGVGWQ